MVCARGERKHLQAQLQGMEFKIPFLFFRFRKTQTWAKAIPTKLMHVFSYTKR
jgi:hypothetical protein